jgi:hypothetical protein
MIQPARTPVQCAREILFAALRSTKTRINTAAPPTPRSSQRMRHMQLDQQVRHLLEVRHEFGAKVHFSTTIGWPVFALPSLHQHGLTGIAAKQRCHGRGTPHATQAGKKQEHATSRGRASDARKKAETSWGHLRSTAAVIHGVARGGARTRQ